MEIVKKDNPGPVGFGGWLIWPFLVLCGTMFFSALALKSQYTTFFNADAWAALTTPGSDAFHTSWVPFLLTGFALEASILVTSIALLVMGLRKKRLFPRGMVAFYVLCVCAKALDLWAAEGFLAEMLPMQMEETQRKSYMALLKSLLTLVIWGSYFLVSKRVRNTFVK